MSISRIGNASFSSAQAVSLTITLPSHQTDDYIVIMVGNGEDSPQPTIDSGTITTNYTPLGTLGFLDYGNGGISTHMYYRKATSGAESNPTITWNTGSATGGGVWALAAVYRSTIGWHDTNPISLNPASGVSTGTSSTPQAPEGFGAIEIIHNNTYVAHFLQTSDNNIQTLGTANGWGTPSGGNTTSGSDGSIYVTEQFFSASGIKDSPIWSLDVGPDNYSWRFIQLREKTITGYWAENLIRVKA